jgi:hypothetical protein
LLTISHFVPLSSLSRNSLINSSSHGLSKSLLSGRQLAGKRSTGHAYCSKIDCKYVSLLCDTFIEHVYFASFLSKSMHRLKKWAQKLGLFRTSPPATSTTSSSTSPSPDQRSACPPTYTYLPNAQFYPGPLPASIPVSGSSISVSQQQVPATTLVSGTDLPTSANLLPRCQINQIDQASATGTREDRAKIAVNTLSGILKAAYAATVPCPPAHVAVGVIDKVVDLFKVISRRRVFSLF